MRCLLALAVISCAISAGCNTPPGAARVDPFPQSTIMAPGSGGSIPGGYVTPNGGAANGYAPLYTPNGGAQTIGTPGANTQFQTTPGTGTGNATLFNNGQSSLRVVNTSNSVASTGHPSTIPQIVTRIPPPGTGSVRFADTETAETSDEGSRLAFVDGNSSSEGFVQVGASETLAAAGAPNRLRATDIVDLPEVGADATDVATSQKSQIRLASHETTVAVAGEPSPTVSRDKFDYDSNYKRLKGKLERSHIDNVWKLRYIPLDGDSDDYGGSVVIADPSLLAQYKEGDFVVARGEVVAAGENGSFAPTYRLDGVERL